MSTHAFTVPDENLRTKIALACHLAMGRPANTAEYEGTTLTLVYVPDLTPAQATLLVETVRAAQTSITRAERNALESQLATLRTFQQLDQNGFIALAQNARDRQLFDTTTALIRVVRALLRD